MLASFLQDITYGLRQLRKDAGFTAVAVLSLALGIGANSAIFQLVNSIRLKSLPVTDPKTLAYLDLKKGSERSGWTSTRSGRFTSALVNEIRKQQQAFSTVMAWSAARLNLSNGGVARYAEAMYVSGDFFETLGVNASLGRTITAQDDTPACSSPGVVLSDSFWQREFGGDPAALGRTVSLQGRIFPVIGVTPASYHGIEVGNRYDLALPMCADRLLNDDPKHDRSTTTHAWWLSMMGRLKPGWTIERADAHLASISPAIMRPALPKQYQSDRIPKFLANKLQATEAATGISGLRTQYEQPLWILMATTGLVLVIACANLANLLLARASVREREIAVRLAIGASRWRLIRQLLAESLLLAAAGSLAGILLAQLLSQGLVSFLTTSRRPVFVDLTLDWRMLGFTALLAVGTCLLFGLLPAFRATHLAPVSAMRSASRSVTAGKDRFSLRRALVGAQVALSLVLLIGALLFVRSLHNLLTTDAGFKAEGVVAVMLDTSKANYPEARRVDVYREIQEKLASCPGVTSIAQVGLLPVSGSGWNGNIGLDGAPALGSGKESLFNRVSPGYFRTMGTGFMAGRDFDDRDNIKSPKVAIVNEVFARKYFGSTNAVGHTFREEAGSGQTESTYQIIGVVRNMKYYALREEFEPTAFFPAAQESDPGNSVSYMVRIQGSPGAITKAIQDTVAQYSPAIGIEYRSFSQQLEESLLRERLMAMLSGAFAILAVVLAAIGLYGVIAYMVARRRNEIGVRMALGADRWRVIQLVLRETAGMVSLGVIGGLVLSYWAVHTASAMLFGIQPYDPVSVSASVVLLAIVGLAASFLPARRAANLEPMSALRDE